MVRWRLGWLRVSHRALDLERSTPYLPVLAHTHESKLVRGEIAQDGYRDLALRDPFRTR